MNRVHSEDLLKYDAEMKRKMSTEKLVMGNFVMHFSRFSYLDCECETLSTTKPLHTNANQSSNQTNSSFTELQSLLRTPEE